MDTSISVRDVGANQSWWVRLVGMVINTPVCFRALYVSSLSVACVRPQKVSIYSPTARAAMTLIPAS